MFSTAFNAHARASARTSVPAPAPAQVSLSIHKPSDVEQARQNLFTKFVKQKTKQKLKEAYERGFDEFLKQAHNPGSPLTSVDDLSKKQQVAYDLASQFASKLF